MLFSGLEKELTISQTENLMRLTERRGSGEPSAYITEHREFYGLDFKVDARVLIPRPETELLVEKAIKDCRQFGYTSVADIGTGCGCIAISLALNLPGATIYATDISPEALEVAEDNCRIHKVKSGIKLLCGNLLEPLHRPVDLIVANLPYVKTVEITSKYEPETALNGGENGLEIIKALCGQLSGKNAAAGNRAGTGGSRKRYFT
jgi:release factor glutamine methyltransferase